MPDDSKNCPIALLREYAKHRPTGDDVADSLYLTVIDNAKSAVWYRKTWIFWKANEPFDKSYSANDNV